MSLILQRLAGLEEVLPLPDIDRHLSCPVSKETEGAIKASILKVGVFALLIIVYKFGISFSIFSFYILRAISASYSSNLLKFIKIILLPE